MYYSCSENKDADQLRGYREADLRLCFRLCRIADCWFSHEAAHMFLSPVCPKKTFLGNSFLSLICKTGEVWDRTNNPLYKASG